ELDAAVLSDGDESVGVRMESSSPLVKQFLSERPPLGRVPEPGRAVGARKQRSTIWPEFDSFDRVCAGGQQFTDRLPRRGIPKASAGLAGTVPEKPHGQHLAVQAEGKARHNLPLRKGTTDFSSGGEIPGPNQTAIVTGRHELAFGMEGNGGNVVGVRI